MFEIVRQSVRSGLRNCILTTALLLASAAAVFATDFTDASGDVTIRLYTGPWVYGAHNNTSVSVDSDFVLVGGGAEVDGMGHPGALLTGSYPDTNLQTWHANSKDHENSYPHYLRAYAIGLRLNGVTSTDLRNYMVLVTQSSTPSMFPNAVAALPPGYLLVGGGARAYWSTQGILLTGSYPNAFQWVASAKAHLKEDTGTVDAFAIGITSGNIPGFGSLTATYNITSTYSPSFSYSSVSVPTPTGWVLSSVGGQSQYQGAGRLLSQLFPYPDPPAFSRLNARATSKDHGKADAGYTSAYAISIKKQ